MLQSNTLINELECALSNVSAERRAKTFHRITDLFVFGSSHFSGDHVALFDNIFNRLIVDIEVTARAALAERLATIPNAPPTVVRTLAFDDAINVAGPILKQSDLLDNVTLVENAGIKSQQHLLAISQRKSLTETVTDVLVERGNRDVALSVARNTGAKFSEAGYVRLVKRSEGDGEFALTVGSRPEIPRHHFLKLLTKASHTIRLKLETAHPNNTSEVQAVVAEVTTAIQAKAGAASRDYIAARTFVESLRALGLLQEKDVQSFARAKKFEMTISALAILCDMPMEVVERAMLEEDAGAMLVIMKAIDFSWPTAKEVLLLRAGKPGIAPHALEQHMADFARLKSETAQRVIKFKRNRQMTAPTTH